MEPSITGMFLLPGKDKGISVFKEVGTYIKNTYMKFQLDALSGVTAPEGGIETNMSEVSVNVSNSPSLKEILMTSCNPNSQYVLGHLFTFYLFNSGLHPSAVFFMKTKLSVLKT